MKATISLTSFGAWPSFSSAIGTVLLTIVISPPPTSFFDLTSEKSGSTPVVSQSIMKLIVPVGASTVACALRKPETSPSSSASSHAWRAAASRSSGTDVEWSMLPTAARCFAITPIIAAAFGRYPSNGPMRFATSADLR